MTTVFEQYYGNLLADAAYVDFGLIGPGQQLQGAQLAKALTLSRRFTAAQAAAIVERFEVVATADSGGFQAAVFRELPLAPARPDGMPGEVAGYGRQPGRLWVALRGTDPLKAQASDFAWADPLLSLTGLAGGQDFAAQEFFASLSMPNPGYALVNANTQINVTGHSLGGHLALNLALSHQSNVAEAFTINTANIGGFPVAIVGALLARYFASSSLAQRITNIQAIPGIQLIGSPLTGFRIGGEEQLMTEAAEYDPLSCDEPPFCAMCECSNHLAPCADLLM